MDNYDSPNCAIIEYSNKTVYVDQTSIHTVWNNDQYDATYIQKNTLTLIKGSIKGRQSMNGTGTNIETDKTKTKYDVNFDEVKRIKFDNDSVISEYNVDSRGDLKIKTPLIQKQEKKYCYKAAMTTDNDQCIVKLELLPESKIASDGVQDKLRTNCALVVGIFKFKKIFNILNYDYPSLQRAYSKYDRYFEYNLGQKVSTQYFNDDLRQVCVPGIHFFMHQEDAINFHGGNTVNRNDINNYDKMQQYDQLLLLLNIKEKEEKERYYKEKEEKEEKIDGVQSEDSCDVDKYSSRVPSINIKDYERREEKQEKKEMKEKSSSESDSDEDLCKVCYEHDLDTKIMKCGHLICKTCLYSWIEHDNTCPFCRGIIEYTEAK